jgi:hypothetical protein
VVVSQFFDDPCDKQALFFSCLHSVVEDTKKPPRFGWSILYSLATVFVNVGPRTVLPLSSFSVSN